MKAKWCDDCEYLSYIDVEKRKQRDAWAMCLMAHPIRFYQPKTLGDAVHGRYGFKRKCLDFESKNKGE